MLGAVHIDPKEFISAACADRSCNMDQSICTVQKFMQRAVRFQITLNNLNVTERVRASLVAHQGTQCVAMITENACYRTSGKACRAG